MGREERAWVVELARVVVVGDVVLGRSVGHACGDARMESAERAGLGVGSMRWMQMHAFSYVQWAQLEGGCDVEVGEKRSSVRR